jgi:hypothetical protein
MPRDRKDTGKSEAWVVSECLLALSKAGCMVWRNNTGVLPDRNGRPVRFGLCVGSSDIIGLAPDGQFLAVECKAALGQPTDAQQQFIAAVRQQGGRAGVARSGPEAVQIATCEHSVMS